MYLPIDRFLHLFQIVAIDTAAAWCGDPKALTKLFKGTAYTQRHKDWFPSQAMPLPRRTMRHQDYSVLRQLLAVTRDQNGAAINSATTLEELDRAYADYLVAMDANDARRHRHLTGRTLHLDAARQRIERFLACRGYSLAHFQDFDFFRLFFHTELRSLSNRGQLHECIRIARALCILLQEQPQLIHSDEKQRNIYGACIAIAGRWAAFHCDDLGAQAVFIAHLERLYSELPDFCIQMVLWSNGLVRGYIPDGHIRAFECDVHSKGSAVFDIIDRHPFPCHTDAADNALKLGSALSDRVKRLGDRTPEQTIRKVLDGGYEEGPEEFSNISYFILSSCYYSNWLLHDKRIDEAWTTLSNARDRLNITPFHFPYLEFSLKESEALAHKAQWELTTATSALVKCFRELETAAGLAEALNLSQRARRLRELQPN